MTLIPVIILLPFVLAALVAVIREDHARARIIYTGSPVLMILSLILISQWVASGGVVQNFYEQTHLMDTLMLAGELALMVLVTWQSFKYKKYPVALLSIVPTCAMVWLEKLSGVEVTEKTHMRLDSLSAILIVIIAVVGGLIVIYAVGYMRGYHHHHKEYADRRGFFLPLLFVFLGAMIGLVLSSNLLWMYFFWEVTSVISFLLIGYTRTEEAVNNSFRALWMNLLGGAGFAGGIIWFVLTHHSTDLYDLVESGAAGNEVAVACAALLAFGALTKSAQFPFSQWLLGAMVAPTPSSALLHSATMVKAGVYLLLRLSPALHGNLAGDMVAFMGGFTFLVCSMLAISQSDGKKVLAYSTISNLGLITACAGVGAAETVWAGVFLIIFHAVSKSMLFQTVGAIENALESRDIEDMHGLIMRLPHLASFMVVGICGMFLAPFGMLVSKWAALKAFVDESRLLGTVLVLMVCYGSATTLLYWSKWLSKILALNHTHAQTNQTQLNEYFSLGIHAALMLFLCGSFPLLSSKVVQPVVAVMYGDVPPTISTGNLTLMVMMLLCVFVFPAFLYRVSKGMHAHLVLNYMAGVNSGDSTHFVDSMGEDRSIVLSAWYMENWFGEKVLMRPALSVATAALVVLMAMILGGAL